MIQITEEKLKAAIQIALSENNVYTEELENTLLHHINALSIGVVISRFPDLGDFVTEKHNKTEWVKTLPNKYDKEIYYGAGFADCYDWIKDLLKNDL